MILRLFLSAKYVLVSKNECEDVHGKTAAKCWTDVFLLFRVLIEEFHVFFAKEFTQISHTPNIILHFLLIITHHLHTIAKVILSEGFIFMLGFLFSL